MITVIGQDLATRISLPGSHLFDSGYVMPTSWSRRSANTRSM